MKIRIFIRKSTLSCRIVKRMIGLKNQRGQGTVEYVLVLALVVAIIFGGIYQLNTAFRVFADNYFGEYLACLLETGELPGVGGGDPNSLCKIEAFDLAKGQRRDGQDGNGGGGAGGPGDDGDQSDADDPSIVKNTSGSPGGGSNAEIGSASGSRNGSNSARTRIRRGGSGGDEDENGSGEGGSSPSAFANSYDQGRTVRIPIRNVDQFGRVINKRKDKEETRTKVSSSTIERGAREGAPERIKVVKRVPASEDKDDGVEFTMGNMLRYLIIIAIIIAIVIFIGGQALQVSKST